MNKRITIKARGRVVTDGRDDRSPLWVEHFGVLLVLGLIVVAGSIVVLSLWDWGRATMVWLGVGLSLVMAIVLFRDPWRSFREGRSARIWLGEALSAFGWCATIVALAVALPYVFWRGFDDLPEWAFAIPGIAAGLFSVLAFLGMRLQLRQPLPTLDKSSRSARVTLNTEDFEGMQTIAVRYTGTDGENHDAELADLIDDSWLDRFAPGSVWQVYAFRDANLADSVVFLTEDHDEVWRNGYKLNGVRFGAENGPIKPGPGSPFLRKDSRWEFET